MWFSAYGGDVLPSSLGAAHQLRTVLHDGPTRLYDGEPGGRYSNLDLEIRNGV